MIRTSHNQTGFSLVETLVAITILLIVIVGPMTLAANAARSTNFSSEQTVAFFLAQEGAELAQKARDDLLLPEFDTVTCGTSNCAWDEFITGPDYDDCFTAAGCGLTIATDAAGTVEVENCSTVTNCRLYYDGTTNNLRSRYTHVSGGGNIETIYTRIVTMNEVTADQEIEVVATVTWRTGDQRQEQSAQVVTYLANVYGR